MNEQVIELTDEFLSGKRQVADIQWLASATIDDALAVIQCASKRVQDAAEQPLNELISLLVTCADRQRIKSVDPNDFGKISQDLSVFYRALADRRVARHDLLSVLTTLGGADNVNAFVELISEDPPRSPVGATVPFLPLFRQQSRDAELLFPMALRALQQPCVAGAVLDVANYLMRQGRVKSHPAAERVDELKELLDGVFVGLESMQLSDSQRESTDEHDFQWENSISLIVSLCDTLALIGDKSAIGTLSRLLTVQHRRLRVEAAAALAKLGDKRGPETLKELAAEPVVRLRVLTYAEELDLTNQIEEQWKSPAAQAEAELVVHLADNTNLGIPPASCELIDSRTQYWPGYEEPRMCFLFRFTYRAVTPENTVSTYSNVGIAGPLVHSFRADLADFSLDDIYAAFAGWQSEHAEIYDYRADEAPASDRAIVDKYLSRLPDEGLSEIELDGIGVFFGERVGLAHACREDVPGALIVDDKSHDWYPQRSGWSIGLDEAYCIYKGQRLLRTFNT